MLGHFKVEGRRIADVEVVDFSAFLYELLSVGDNVSYGVFDVGGPAGDFHVRHGFSPSERSSYAPRKINVA